jgi:hypothetical protein
MREPDFKPAQTQEAAQEPLVFGGLLRFTFGVTPPVTQVGQANGEMEGAD